MNAARSWGVFCFRRRLGSTRHQNLKNLSARKCGVGNRDREVEGVNARGETVNVPD